MNGEVQESPLHELLSVQNQDHPVPISDLSFSYRGRPRDVCDSTP